MQHPHQFFVRRNFYKLNDVGPVFLLATASRAEDDGIAVGQAVGGLEIMEDNVGWQVGLAELPHGLALGADFAHQLIVLVGDEGIAVMQADCSPRSGNVVAPYRIEIFVVLHHLVHLEERKQVGAVGGHTDAPKLRVHCLLIGETLCRKLMFYFNCSGPRVNDHQLGRQSILYQQDLVESNGLAAMDFGTLRGIVVPD